MLLHAYLAESARVHPKRVAIVDPGHGSQTYAQLESLSDQACALLQSHGVGRGSRVGIVLHKSTDAVAAQYGTLKTGAAYVPIDADGPMIRAAVILHDSKVDALFVEASLLESLSQALSQARAPLDRPPAILVLDRVGGGAGLRRRAEQAGNLTATPVSTDDEDLAYILYTSGSTGRPKGAMLSHANASSFVEWASLAIGPCERDHFSAHAPFHFDLSIFDLYVCARASARLVLVSESVGRHAHALGDLLEREAISIWYSAPTILRMLVEAGEFERRPLPALKRIIFAGEVFPIEAFRRLQHQLEGRCFFNFYGPTETNVCTYYQVPDPLPDSVMALPIGKVCENLEARVVDAEGVVVPPGTEGELWITGPNVMQGYFQLETRNQRAFAQGPDGRRFYRTGDLVVAGSSGRLEFRGRRDRMVKRRGYRVELGEIEACLQSHPEIRAAAVTATSRRDEGISVAAHLEHVDGRKLSGLKLRKFCATRLPPYMIPDVFRFYAALPQTSTHKTDYQRLSANEAAHER
ncbi:MAG: amino acid adenylation domain-containing protein [Nannocystaceae bacterium]